MNSSRNASNRANAQHSTGPIDTRRTRFNGISHGLTSKHIVIPGESQEEYDEFRRLFIEDLNPRTAIESALADRIVAAAWRLKRFGRTEHAFYNDRVNAFLEAHPDADPDAGLANLFVDPVEVARMRLFLRYQTSVQREYDKATAEYAKAQAASEKAIFQEVLAESMRPPREAEPEHEAVAEVGFASQNHPEPMGAMSPAEDSSIYPAMDSPCQTSPYAPEITRVAGRSAQANRALP